ncbi:MAG: radical SAM protein [Gammaproteobacteria bacterium]|nr:radical SAM protein [Gammaproteobacteria bacterium]
MANTDFSANDLYLLAVNLTRRCNLACAHCYLDAETLKQGGADELQTAEVNKLLDQVASRGTDTMVVLTGGEPLLRRDLEEMVTHGSELGLSMVIGTNGVALTDRRVKSLQAAGAMGVGISLDSLDPVRHDEFRGYPGGWEKTLAGMEACRRNGLPFQVHFSVTEENADEIGAMIDFAASVGAHVLNVFFLICTGRGESMSDITPERYERVLEELVDAQANTDLIVRARCAPHFKRVAYQRDPDTRLTRAEGYEGGGCLAGIHYCRVTPEGGITACPYIPDEEGNLRQTPFWEIWDGSPTFSRLRDPRLEGNCGDCEFRLLCGGCRARPKALGGSLMDADPWCVYAPGGGELIQPLAANDDGDVTWSKEAEQRLSRVPGFLRKMVRKRAEDYVREVGETVVTVEHMATLAARRFGDDGPPSAQKSPRFDTLAWTREAQRYLAEIPGFMRDGIQEVAESVAREEGRLEVNMKLIRRLEGEASWQRKYSWEPAAEQKLTEMLDSYPATMRTFVKPTMEAAAEREAKRRSRRNPIVSADDVNSVFTTHTAGVEWEPEVLRRVESAPEFVRAGIKKAAEFNARREGISIITDEDLTRFRNRAMMRAVRRMKSFGMRELDFSAFEIARERVPRLKDNIQAAKRFAAIQNYVESNRDADGGGLGLMDRDLIEQMKAELKSGNRKSK